MNDGFKRRVAPGWRFGVGAGSLAALGERDMTDFGRAAACAAAASLLAGWSGGVAAAASAAQAISPATLAGAWVADDQDTRDLTRVTVRRSGQAFLVSVWGRCHPTDCPWGEAAGLLRADTPKPELDIVYQHGFSTDRMSLRVVEPDLLAYRVETTFHDNSGRPDRVGEALLRRARPPIRR